LAGECRKETTTQPNNGTQNAKQGLLSLTRRANFVPETGFVPTIGVNRISMLNSK
jgi:hypothetical protein